MNNLLQLLRWDLLLLHRNQLILISFAIATLYMGLFYLLQQAPQLEQILILLIFNDPLIMGYMFAGVLLLLEKNQNTLQAIAVSPLPLKHYLWSKAIALCLLSTSTAIAMTVIGAGCDLHWLHLLVGVGGGSLFFSLAGFGLAANAQDFNSFLFRSIGFLVLLGLPVLSLFDLVESALFYLLPSYPSLLLLQASFTPVAAFQLLYAYTYLLISIILIAYWTQKRVQTYLLL